MPSIFSFSANDELETCTISLIGSANPKSEARSTKQIQITNVAMFKTEQAKRAFGLSFRSFEFWSLGIVSDFGIRIFSIGLLQIPQRDVTIPVKSFPLMDS